MSLRMNKNGIVIINRSLPPMVDGKVFGYLNMKVDEVLWTKKYRDSVSILVKWWGERTPATFRPLNVRTVTKQPSADKSVCYEIRTSATLFEEYLKNCETLELVVTDSQQIKIVGSATIPNLCAIIQDNPYQRYFPILSNNGYRIGELHIGFNLHFIQTLFNTANRLNINRNSTLEIFMNEENSKKKQSRKLKHCDKSTSMKCSKSLLKCHDLKSDNPTSNISNSESRQIQGNEVPNSLILNVLEQGQKLRDAMVRSILDDGDILALTENSEKRVVNVERASRGVPCDDAVIVDFLLGKTITSRDEEIAMERLKNTSPIANLLEAAEEMGKNWLISTHQEKFNKGTDHVMNNQGHSTSTEDEDRKSVEEIDHLQSSEPSGSTLQHNDMLLEHINSLQVIVHSLSLSKNAMKQLRIFESGSFYFVEYDLPSALDPLRNKDNIRNNRPWHSNLKRLCSRKQVGTDIYFEQSSVHNVSSSSLQKHTKKLNLRFKIYVRQLHQKLPSQIGMAVFSMERLLGTQTLACCKIIKIFASGVPEQRLVIGELKVSVAFGNGSKCFGADLMNKLNSEIDNHDCIDQNSDTSVVSTSLESQKKRKQVKLNVAERTSASNPELKDQFQYILLRGLINISEGKGFNPVDCFLVCRTFWKEDVITSDISWGSENPHFNFHEVIPVLLTPELLERSHNNFLITEVWEKRISSEHNILIGIAKLPLNKFYVAYRDPMVVEQLLLSKYPVIGIDGWISVLNPVTRLPCGQLLVTLALGTEDQVQLLEMSRGLKEIVYSSTQTPHSALSFDQQVSVLKEIGCTTGTSMQEPLSVSSLDPQVNVLKDIVKPQEYYIAEYVQQNSGVISSCSETPGLPSCSSLMSFNHVVRQDDEKLSQCEANSVCPQFYEDKERKIMASDEPKYKDVSTETTVYNEVQEIVNLHDNNTGDPLSIHSEHLCRAISDQAINLHLPVYNENCHTEIIRKTQGSQTDFLVLDLTNCTTLTEYKKTDISLNTQTLNVIPEGVSEKTKTQSINTGNLSNKQVNDIFTDEQVASDSIEDENLSSSVNSVSVAFCEDPKLQIDTENSVFMHLEIESGAHLQNMSDIETDVQGTYVSVLLNSETEMVTPVVPYTNTPSWHWHCDIWLPTHLLSNKNKRLVFKVWQSESICKDPTRDLVVGFAAVDLTVLLYGMPWISGWFNIVDFTGHCNGQIKINITPLENESCLTLSKARDLRYREMDGMELCDESWFLCPAEENEGPGNRRDMTDDVEPQEDLTSSFLAHALKQKLCELDVITQRLRRRLQVVTEDDDCLILDEDEGTKFNEIDERANKQAVRHRDIAYKKNVSDSNNLNTSSHSYRVPVICNSNSEKVQHPDLPVQVNYCENYGIVNKAAHQHHRDSIITHKNDIRDRLIGNEYTAKVACQCSQVSDTRDLEQVSQEEVEVTGLVPEDDATDEFDKLTDYLMEKSGKDLELQNVFNPLLFHHLLSICNGVTSSSSNIQECSRAIINSNAELTDDSSYVVEHSHIKDVGDIGEDAKLENIERIRKCNLSKPNVRSKCSKDCQHMSSSENSIVSVEDARRNQEATPEIITYATSSMLDAIEESHSAASSVSTSEAQDLSSFHIDVALQIARESKLSSDNRMTVHNSLENEYDSSEDISQETCVFVSRQAPEGGNTVSSKSGSHASQQSLSSGGETCNRPNRLAPPCFKNNDKTNEVLSTKKHLDSLTNKEEMRLITKILNSKLNSSTV